MAEERRSGKNSSIEGDGNLPNNDSQQTNGHGFEAIQEHENREIIEDSILVVSSDTDEPQSSLTPVPSSFDGEAPGSCFSPRSTSSDG